MACILLTGLKQPGARSSRYEEAPVVPVGVEDTDWRLSTELLSPCRGVTAAHSHSNINNSPLPPSPGPVPPRPSARPLGRPLVACSLHRQPPTSEHNEGEKPSDNGAEYFKFWTGRSNCIYL